MVRSYLAFISRGHQVAAHPRRDTSIILEGREKLGMGNHTNKGIKCRRGTDSGERMLKGALSSNPVSKLK